MPAASARSTGSRIDVPRGGIFGLLGPNGAGKSTLINILAGLVTKSGGSATVWGFDIDEHPRNAKRSIGVVPQEIIVRSLLHAEARRWRSRPGSTASPRPSGGRWSCSRAVRLEDKADAYARTLSGGMKRRLLVAKAMVHSPPILVLDEPTAGVDVELRQQLWDYVRCLNAQGVTIVLTTHYLEEAEQLCDRIAIINHGRLIANEATRDPGRHGAGEGGRGRRRPRRRSGAGQRLLRQDRADRASARWRSPTARTGSMPARCSPRCRSEGLGIVDVSTREPDLEDVFLNLTRATGTDG